jgi:hypothetical protein
MEDNLKKSFTDRHVTAAAELVSSRFSSTQPKLDRHQPLVNTDHSCKESSWAGYPRRPGFISAVTSGLIQNAKADLVRDGMVQMAAFTRPKLAIGNT